eukprot:g8527.t1
MCRFCNEVYYDYSDDVTGTSTKTPEDVKSNTNATSGKSPKISKYAPKHKLLATNLLDEKAKFFASNDYNPQFSYRIGKSARNKILENSNNEQQTKLLPEAIAIMKEAVEKYGRGNVLKSKDPIEGSEDDRELSLTEASVMLNDFLKKSRVDHHCNIQFADMHNSGTFINRKSVSYARFKCKDEYFDKSSSNCKHTLYVSINLNRNPIRLKSFAVHEIGTHLVRRVNEEVQPWCFGRSNFKLRKPGETRSDIQTEEGFATINDTLVTPGQLLTQHAVTYFVSAKAKTSSFREIFEMLEPFVKDNDTRWKFCVNAKRGIEDSSQPGGDGKAQAYFEGAVEILKNIATIDIPLLFCGKIALNEHDRVKRVVRREGLTLPPFVNSIEEYRYKLLNMAFLNKLISAVPLGYKPTPPIKIMKVRNPIYHYSSPTQYNYNTHRKLKACTPTSSNKSVAVGSPVNAVKAKRPSTASVAEQMSRENDDVHDFNQLKAQEREARIKRQEERDRKKEEKKQRRQEQMQRDSDRKMKKMYGNAYKRKKNRQKYVNGKKKSRKHRNNNKHKNANVLASKSDSEHVDDIKSNLSSDGDEVNDNQYAQKSQPPPKPQKIVSDILGAVNESTKSNSTGTKKKKYSNVKRKPLYQVPSSKRSLSPIQQDLEFSINDLQRLYPTMKFSEAAPSNGNNLPVIASHRVKKIKKANVLVL